MICRRKQTIWKAELGDPDEKTGQIDGKLNLTVNRPGECHLMKSNLTYKQS